MQLPRVLYLVFDNRFHFILCIAQAWWTNFVQRPGIAGGWAVA
ncbi:UNVERIFIED_ORG: hypothetical protein FHT06_002507 [Xanthomonas campestris]